MADIDPAEYQVPPLDHEQGRFWARQIASAVNLLMQGRSNNVINVTLNTSAATTTISDARISAYTVPICVPTTANAAAISMPYRDFSTSVNGSMILTHANNANTDKTFKIVLVG